MQCRAAARARSYWELRRRSQPTTEATAGCVFRNPPLGPPAGQLIDQLGLKGLRAGELLLDVAVCRPRRSGV